MQEVSQAVEDSIFASNGDRSTDKLVSKMAAALLPDHDQKRAVQPPRLYPIYLTDVCRQSQIGICQLGWVMVSICQLGLVWFSICQLGWVSVSICQLGWVWVSICQLMWVPVSICQLRGVGRS